MKIEDTLENQFEEIGNDHISTSEDTPLRSDAFDLDDAEKIERIRENVREIMLTLGLDLTDDSLKGTPNRVAKMYVISTHDICTAYQVSVITWVKLEKQGKPF